MNLHSIKAKFTNYLIQSPVRFFLVAAIAWMVLMGILNWIFGTQWGDILVEANGMAFDLLVFGLLLSLYEKLKDERETIKRLHEEIDDYRGWNEKEATYRIIGAVRRLNKLGVSKIDLSFCFLQSANLVSLNFQGATFKGAILQDARLDKANLKDADFLSANLQEAKLWEADCERANFSSANLMGANLDEANFENAKFVRANLISAILWKANLKKANFDRALLKSANFQETNLQAAFLTNVSVQDSNFVNTDLKGATVSINWFGQMQHFNVEGGNEIMESYDLERQGKFGVLRLKRDDWH